ncbi:MAG TPA: DNA-directed RNA polymerase subunit omega [Vicinamibacterales bacterium]|jgi:DNA-directed RNA polymerase subunit K/omega
MTFGSPDVGKFEFVTLATLRAAQLMRGCTPRVPAAGKPTTTAQREVAGGMVCSGPRTSGPNRLGVVP